MSEKEDLEDGEIREEDEIHNDQQKQKIKDKRKRSRGNEGKRETKRKKTANHCETCKGRIIEGRNEGRHREEEGGKRGDEKRDGKDEKGERREEKRDKKNERGEGGNVKRDGKNEKGESGGEKKDTKNEREGGIEKRDGKNEKGERREEKRDKKNERGEGGIEKRDGKNEKGERREEKRDKKNEKGEGGNEKRDGKNEKGERGDEKRDKKNGRGEGGNEKRDGNNEKGERGDEKINKKNGRGEEGNEKRDRKNEKGEEGNEKRDRKENGGKRNENRNGKSSVESETRVISEDLSLKMRRIICSSGGSIELEQLKQSLDLDLQNMITILNAELGFSLMISDWEKKSMAVSRSALRVCSEQTKKCAGDCEKVHLCRYFILQSCNRTPCAFNHDMKSGKNLAVLKMYGLEKMTMEELRTLLLQNDPSFLPEVCHHYNKGESIYGSCTFGTNCQKLHICQYFLHGDCRYRNKCKRSHDIFAQDTLIKLHKWGISDDLVSRLPTLYRNASVLRDNKTSLPNKKAATTEKKENPLPCALDKSPNHLDHSGEICLYHIRKSCSFKEKCGNVHYHLPYRWQVQHLSHWKDLENMVSIEEAYCDINKTICTMDLNFETMTYKSQKIRRLSTPSSVSKPPHFILTTDWLWYWMDEYSKWNEYGKESNMHKASDLSSIDLEKAYLSGKAETLTFKAGTETYELRMKDMVQKNLKHGTERKVLRRPRFLSEAEVKKRKSRKSEPSDVDRKYIPPHWDISQVPEVGYKLVTLDQSSEEYNKVKDSFHHSLRTVSILSIERIQNPALWEVYQWQKEQMKKQNGGTEVSERQLFHGTDDKLVDAICQQNFDWRICGTHGTMYGKGSYFAKDASYSHSYSTTTFSKTRVMFVARVLVGDFTTGNPSYLRPPSKNMLASSCFYDSCVDKMFNPSIFIIFEKHQIYPEYLIKYL